METTSSNRITIRLTDEMDQNLERIFDWANNPNNQLTGYQTKKDLIRLALELSVEYFVRPFEDNELNDYSHIRSRYLKNSQSVDKKSLSQLQNLMTHMLKNQEVELILLVNLLSQDDGLSAEEKVNQLESYLITNSRQAEVVQKADALMKKNATIRTKLEHENK